MRVSVLRKELHLAIDKIKDENLLEAVQNILNKGIYDYELHKEQKKELNARLEDHKAGSTPSTPFKKSLKKIRSKLK